MLQQLGDKQPSGAPAAGGSGNSIRSGDTGPLVDRQKTDVLTEDETEEAADVAEQAEARAARLAGLGLLDGPTVRRRYLSAG